MKNKAFGSIRTAALIILSGLSLSLTSCGGGGDATPSVGGGGTAPSGEVDGVISGTITAVSDGQSSRVRVNGIDFKTRGAKIRRNGSEMPTHLLKVGMVVRLKGHFDDSSRGGEAAEIDFDDNLNGPVAAVDSANKELTVLGQIVVVSSTTVFEGVRDLDALNAGTMVEVSGLPDASGNILATRIERQSARFVPNRTKVELRGTVGTITGQSLTIGGLTVHSGTPLPAGLSAGAVVKVEGTLAALAGPLQATEIEVRNADLNAADGQVVHLTGFVTNYVSNANFTVNGTVVNANSLSVTGVALNVMVQVDGKMVNGVLMASSVTAQPAPPMPAPSPAPAPAPIDGVTLYDDNCASCHGPLASSNKKGTTAAQIQAGITGNRGGWVPFPPSPQPRSRPLPRHWHLLRHLLLPPLLLLHRPPLTAQHSTAAIVPGATVRWHLQIRGMRRLPRSRLGSLTTSAGCVPSPP